MAAQLQFRDVTLCYDRHPAVHHLTGEVATGTLLAVVGPNGAGKSTLFRGLVGILKPLSGSISLGGLDLHDIAYLPQSADIDRSFPLSVFDFVASGLWRQVGFFGGIGKKERAQIAHALAAVGLTGFENRGIGTPSMQKPPPICWRWSSAGMRRGARCWPRCMTSNWCGRIFRTRCCSRASRLPGVRPRMC